MDLDTGPADTPVESVNSDENPPIEENAEAPAPSPPPRRRWPYAVAAVVVAVGVVLALLFTGIIPIAHLNPSSGNSPPPVTVTVKSEDLSFVPSNNPCFGSDYASTSPSTLSAGGTLTVFHTPACGVNTACVSRDDGCPPASL